MASMKISAMNGAGEVRNEDAFPLVDFAFGLNYRCTRALLLTSGDNEAISLVAQDNASVSMRTVTLGAEITIDTTAELVYMFSAWDMDIEVTDYYRLQADSIALKNTLGTKFILIEDDGSGLFEDAITIKSDQNITIDADDTVTVQGGLITLLRYYDVDPADWDGDPPDWVHEALNRLAAAVAGLLSGPIP